MTNAKLWEETQTVLRSVKMRALEPVRDDAKNINDAFDEYAKEITSFIHEIVSALDSVGLCDSSAAHVFDCSLKDAIGAIQGEIEWRVEERIQERVS